LIAKLTFCGMSPGEARDLERVELADHDADHSTTKDRAAARRCFRAGPAPSSAESAYRCRSPRARLPVVTFASDASSPGNGKPTATTLSPARTPRSSRIAATGKRTGAFSSARSLPGSWAMTAPAAASCPAGRTRTSAHSATTWCLVTVWPTWLTATPVPSSRLCSA
jgi:hypothetical protein